MPLTDALTELGYSHHAASRQILRIYGVLCGRVIVDEETGNVVGLMDLDDAWQFVRARRQDRGISEQTALCL